MKQTVTSKYEPKSKNVTWIDMSTGSPVQKNFINGMWRSVGSGGSSSGSGLPTVSAEDKGKVMQVVKAEKIGSHTEFDIIPEQNVDPGEEIPYSNTDLTYFKEGNTVTMVATFEDGTTETYTNVVMYDNGSTFVGFNGEYMMWDWVFYESNGYMWCDGWPEDVSVYMGSGHTVNIRLYTDQVVDDYKYDWQVTPQLSVPYDEPITLPTREQPYNSSTDSALFSNWPTSAIGSNYFVKENSPLYIINGQVPLVLTIIDSDNGYFVTNQLYYRKYNNQCGLLYYYDNGNASYIISNDGTYMAELDFKNAT